MRRATKPLAWSAVLVALAAVFMLYTRPDFLVDIGNQLWTCF